MYHWFLSTIKTHSAHQIMLNDIWKKLGMPDWMWGLTEGTPNAMHEISRTISYRRVGNMSCCLVSLEWHHLSRGLYPMVSILVRSVNFMSILCRDVGELKSLNLTFERPLEGQALQLSPVLDMDQLLTKTWNSRLAAKAGKSGRNKSAQANMRKHSSPTNPADLISMIAKAFEKSSWTMSYVFN